MALIVTDNSVRQINAALLSLEKKIGETNSEKAQDKQVVQMELKNVQYDFMAPLYQSGNSVSINTTGTWEGNARSATTAEHAITADNVEHADTATTAVHAETATKVSNALTVNGKTYDGSSAVNAGVQTVANGGTGVTTQADINKSFISNLDVGASDVTDGTEFVSSWASDNGFAEKNALNTPYKRQFIKVWNYIKDKISSVLGLTATAYGGKANTAGTADKAVNAEHASTADNVEHANTSDTATSADTATNANISKTLDTVNGDKLQIGSGTAVNITNAVHAVNADNAAKANIATSSDKVKNALTVNGKTYDGSSAVNVGVQTVANGGTGVTTQADINKAFISNLGRGNDNVTDGTEFVSSWASDNGFADSNAVNKPYKRQFIKVWNYIKDKISSVLGLTATAYGGKANTAGTADMAKHATTADNGVPKYSTSDAGKNLAVNSSGNAVGWVKPQTIKFVDYKTESLTFSSSKDQKKIALSNFGPEVTEDNVLSFMVIYWDNLIMTASGDWAKSQGTGSSGLCCALHAPSGGTGWCVIRCVYLA